MTICCAQLFFTVKTYLRDVLYWERTFLFAFAAHLHELVVQTGIIPLGCRNEWRHPLSVLFPPIRAWTPLNEIYKNIQIFSFQFSSTSSNFTFINKCLRVSNTLNFLSLLNSKKSLMPGNENFANAICSHIIISYPSFHKLMA